MKKNNFHYYVLIYQDFSTAYFAGTCKEFKQLSKSQPIKGYFAYESEPEAILHYSKYEKN